MDNAPKSVDDYIASQPAAVQKLLARVRSIIRRAVPEAEEGISYRIPVYKLRGRVVIYFAGWKQHYSLYPATAAMTAKFGKELSGLQMSKGTIRFPLDEPVPAKLIAELAKFRARETAEHEQTRVARTSAARASRRARK